VTKNAEPAIDRTLDVRADLNITKDDLVAIRIADVEKLLHEQKLQVQEDRRKADAALRKAQEELPKLQEKIAAQTVGHELADLLKLANKFRCDKKAFEVSTFLRTEEKPRRTYAVAVIHGIDGVEAARALSAQDAGTLAMAHQAVDEAERAIKECEERMLDIKRKLADIPMLERQAKAAVARAVMGDGDGKTLLSIVQRVTLAGLPAPKE